MNVEAWPSGCGGSEQGQRLLALVTGLAFKLMRQLVAAKRPLRLEQEFKKLNRFNVLILDNIGDVQKGR